MLKTLSAFLLLAFAPALFAQSPASADWRAKVEESLPLLGHRNWILIVDSAYPLQASTGIETVETNAGQLEVAHFVLNAINHSIHVRPDIFMDAELPFVSESDAPGVGEYRRQVADLLHGQSVQSRPHEQILAEIDQASRVFHILVLKTNLAVPYTSVFIRLNCKYWGDDAELTLRSRMNAAASH